jgi:hypothetical protein
MFGFKSMVKSQTAVIFSTQHCSVGFEKVLKAELSRWLQKAILTRWLHTMSPSPSLTKLIAARLLIAKSTAKSKKNKAKKADATTTPPTAKTGRKGKENVIVPALKDFPVH